MKKITSFTIDKSDLVATASSTRSFTVSGEKDAEFMIQVFDGSRGFYDFRTKTFQAKFVSASKLNIKMVGDSYSGVIKFPVEASGDTYTILLLAPPDKDTELTFSYGKNSYSTTITQVANATLTFTTSSGTSAAYGTPPTVTSTASPVTTSSVTKTVDWTVTNTEDDTYGFGLRLTRQPIDTDWYFTTTETVNQPVDTGSTTEVVVDDLTDLCTGMYITAGTGLSGTPTITAIDTATKTLTLSTVQNFADGVTLTFQARGSSVIQDAIGANIDFSSWNSDVNTVTLTSPFTKTIRATGSDEEIALNNTYGITGGGYVEIKGLNVVNTSANTVQTVSADADGTGTDGTITVQVAQTTALAVGTTIYIGGTGIGQGSRETLDIDNEIIINSHPSSNRNIYLDLDNFITLGTDGS